MRWTTGSFLSTFITLFLPDLVAVSSSAAGSIDQLPLTLTVSFRSLVCFLCIYITYIFVQPFGIILWLDQLWVWIGSDLRETNWKHEAFVMHDSASRTAAIASLPQKPVSCCLVPRDDDVVSLSKFQQLCSSARHWLAVREEEMVVRLQGRYGTAIH